MQTSLEASYYADHAVQCTVPVVENEWLARDTYRIRFHAPEIAKRIHPGQFVMLRLARCDDPLIGRPLALYDTVHQTADGDPSGGPECVDVVYVVKGKLTTRLQHVQRGQKLDVWGPLGNGFFPQPCQHLIMVAGGIGQTPFLALAQEYLGRKQYGNRAWDQPATDRVTLCYGARSQDLLAGVPEFRQAGVDVQVATDDGSAGHHGLVTELLEQILKKSDAASVHVVCCGPEPMMEAVTALALAWPVTCEVSLETPMACGIGICFSCVARIKDADGVADYKRTCVEGPVFDAARVEW